MGIAPVLLSFYFDASITVAADICGHPEEN